MHSVFRSFRHGIHRISIFAIAVPLSIVRAQDAPPTAQDLATRLSGMVQDGSSSVRLKMEVRNPAGGPKAVLQLLVKSRRTKGATDLIYQVLWPKERKGEAILLRTSADRAPAGAAFVPPESLKTIGPAQMKEALFGSDLSLEDVLENFFAWEHQAIVGEEVVDRVPCRILESKPGKGDRSTYARVRSWIDLKRMVPLRIEKFTPSGDVARRIDTTRVAKDDTGRPVGASFVVRRPGQDSVTELEGSNSRHDVALSDADFAPDALRGRAAPPK